MSLFHIGAFTAASGRVLPWKIECDALTDADWNWAALQIACQGPFSFVEGVPTGGLRLASILRPFAETHRQVEPEGPLLIVDDVLTTGGSMERQRAGRDAIGFVVFARGPLPPWVRALWAFTGDEAAGELGEGLMDDVRTYAERQGPVTIPGELVRDLWSFVKMERDKALDTVQRQENLNGLLTRMKDAGMADHLPTLEEVRAEGPYTLADW